MSTRLNNSRARWLGATAIALILSVTAPTSASAQLFFDWGGSSEKKVNDTGRMSVRINAPEHKPGDIVVSFSDRKLFMMVGPNQAVSYPVAIPREQDRWEGKTTVTQKRENPSWTPTPTMIKENPRLPRWVPGGHPMNPLGNRALYLGSSLYRIHGTDAPWTIGTAVSKGCIRMYNKDAQEVYDRTKVGAKVLVTWKSYQFQPDGSTEGQAQTAQSAPQPDQPSAAQQRTSRDLARTFDPSAAEPMPRRRRTTGETADVTSPAPAPAPAPAASVTSDRPVRASHTRIDQPVRQRSAVQGAAHQGSAPQVQPATPSQTQQPRRTKDRSAASAAVAVPAAAASVATPSSAFDDGSPAVVSPIETGAVPAARSPAPAEVEPAAAKPAPAARETTPSTPRPQPVASPASDDFAARALVAAERAAAAAERAAAAAERAERAAKASPASAPASGPAAEAAPSPSSD